MIYADGSGRDRGESRRPSGPTRREAVEGIAGELEAAGIESSRLEAERLLSMVIGVARAELQRSLDAPLDAAQARALARAVGRRRAGEPLQHIEGEVEFRDLLLVADPRAFIPRPETEQLVERVLEWARARRWSGRAEPPVAGASADAESTRPAVRVVRRPPDRAYVATALDIGVGSGAIALSLAHERIADKVIAIDSSEAALEQAAENRERAALSEGRVELRRVTGALWGAVGRAERFDLIVSNPPYISTGEMAELPPAVRRDPPAALTGGEDGLDLIREILSEAWHHLEPGGAIFLEIGERQGDRVRKLLAEAGSWVQMGIEADLSGRERFAFAERGGEADASP